MKAPSPDAGFSAQSPEARLSFMLAYFSEAGLIKLFENNMPPPDEIGEVWTAKLKSLIKAVASLYIHKRDHVGDPAGQATLQKCFSYQEITAETSLKLTPVNAYKDISEDNHQHLSMMMVSAFKNIMTKLAYSASDLRKPPKIGDVILEGKGFEVVVGEKQQTVIKYPEGTTSIILMHDPRDGHFLLVERFSDVVGGYVLELPKAISTTGGNKENIAAIALRDQTGLSLRNLEKIGEICPDSNMIKGVCEVYYGNFDLEENYEPRSPLIRSVKRVNEEGVFQAAYEGRVTCAQTLAALSIWQAFESVRKKRLANSRRDRKPKVLADETEDD